MFAYCGNDPVNNEDPNGDIAWWVGAAAVGAIMDSAIYLYQTREGEFSWSGLGKAAALGAISGVALGGAGKYLMKGIRALLTPGKAKELLRRANLVFKGTKEIYFNITKKIFKQMGNRGWTEGTIRSTINKPYTTRSATNKATGNKATAYFNKDGSYVIRDNKTGDIIQISNRNDPNWIPDSSIKNPYIK